MSPKRHDRHEEWAIQRLAEIVELDRLNRDALPGSAVKHVKAALTIMRKRRRTGRTQLSAEGRVSTNERHHP